MPWQHRRLYGRDLTNAEYAAPNSHIWVNGNGGESEAPFSRTATIVLAASDSSAQDQAEADVVCVGVADDVAINAAIQAAGKSTTIFLHKGTYHISSSINLDQDGQIFGGAGWAFDLNDMSVTGVKIVCDSDMTNSLHVTGNETILRDFYVDGNAHADRLFYDRGGSNLTAGFSYCDHIASRNHKVYNLYSTASTHHITGRSWFYGKPVWLDCDAMFIDGTTSFNGNGDNLCLIVSGAIASIHRCLFESFTPCAIQLGSTGKPLDTVSLLGNWFSDIFSSDYVIYQLGTGCYLRAGEISGNYHEGLGTKFLYLPSTEGLNVYGNRSFSPIEIATMGESRLYGGSFKHTAGINFNGQTGLKQLELKPQTGVDFTQVPMPFTYPGSGTPGIADFDGTAAPTTGTWQVGDTCWNISAATGGTLGWRCVTGGTPGIWEVINNYSVSSGDAANLLFSNPDEKQTSSTVYVAVKGTVLDADYDSLTIAYTYKIQVGTNNGYFRLYKNGSPIGTEKQDASAVNVWSTWAETFTGLLANDLLEVWAYSDTGGQPCKVKNFNFYQSLAATIQDP